MTLGTMLISPHRESNPGSKCVRKGQTAVIQQPIPPDHRDDLLLLN